MAERNYTITIKANGLVEDESPIAGNKKSDSENTRGLLSKEGAKAFAKGMVAYGTVKSFATQIINHEVSLVELRTGSNELQIRANFINERVQNAVGVLETAVTGALVGGGVGAIVGLALGTAHKLISYGQRQQTLDLQRSLENETIQRNYIRAGAKGYRSNEQL